MHDLGGLQGFGPVVTADGEHTHHDAWELRAQAIAMVVGGGTVRPWIERIPPAQYLAAGYYERWLIAAEHAVTERGIVDPSTLAARREELADLAEPPRLDDAAHRSAMEVYMTTVHPMPPATSPRFAAGDAVRVARMRPTEQNRCPRYVRGAPGTIESVCGDDVLPGARDRTDVVYSVQFASGDLWGATDEPPFTVVVDLFEHYLEVAG